MALLCSPARCAACLLCHIHTPPAAACPAALPTQVPDVNGILDRLLLFLGYEKDYVTAETLIQVGRSARSVPERAGGGLCGCAAGAGRALQALRLRCRASPSAR